MVTHQLQVWCRPVKVRQWKYVKMFLLNATYNTSMMVVKVGRHPDMQKTGDNRRLADKPSVIKRYDDTDDQYSQ